MEMGEWKGRRRRILKMKRFDHRSCRFSLWPAPSSSLSHKGKHPEPETIFYYYLLLYHSSTITITLLFFGKEIDPVQFIWGRKRKLRSAESGDRQRFLLSAPFLIPITRGIHNSISPSRRILLIAGKEMVNVWLSCRWWNSETVAVVTGANRGIGFEIARQLCGHGMTVILTSRDSAIGHEAASVLKEGGFNAVSHQLDVVDPSSIQQFAEWVQQNYGFVDILVRFLYFYFYSDSAAIISWICCYWSKGIRDEIRWMISSYIVCRSTMLVLTLILDQKILLKMRRMLLAPTILAPEMWSKLWSHWWNILLLALVLSMSAHDWVGLMADAM